MKKRIFSLLMALLMLSSMFMASCTTGTATKDEGEAGDGVIEADTLTARNPETITLTLITGDETTEAAIKDVQRAINLITKPRFKTQIELRYYTREEYNDKIDAMIAMIAEEESKKADENAAKKAAEEEAKRLAAIEKLMDKDRPEKKDEGVIKIFNQEFIPRETEEVTTVEQFETEQDILNKFVQKYPTATESQLDVFLIMGTNNLSKYVKDEKYATDGESFLVAMDEWLTLDSKILTQYINPTVLLGGKVGSSTYAIPTNRQIASEYKYLVLNKKLIDKYNIDSDSIKSLTDSAMVEFLSTIAKNEPNVAPMLAKEESAPGIIGLFPGEETIFGTYVANTSTVGFKAAPRNLLTSWQYTDHFIYMKQYERNGYFAKNPTEDTEFGVAVMRGDESFPETLNEDEYIVKILEKPIATSETTGEYMLGISKYSEAPERCMEIITYLNTNEEFRNLLQYGIVNEHYKLDEDTGKLERLNHDYMMDIYVTGNAFIAYPEEDMELDVWEIAKNTNRSTLVSPYLGFLFENENNAETITAVKKLSDDMLKRVAEFDPITRREELLVEYQNEIDKSKADLVTYQAEYAAAEALYSKYQGQVEALDADLKAAKDVLAAENALHTPFATKVTSAQSKVDRTQKELDAAKAEETPDQDEITKLEAELKEYTDAYNAAVEAAKPTADKVAAAEKTVADAQKAYNDFMATEIPGQFVGEGEEQKPMTVKDAQTAVNARKRKVTSTENVITQTENKLAKLQYTTPEEYDVVLRRVYNDFFDSLEAELALDTNYVAFTDPENENSVVYIYEEWYSSMYAA